MTNQPLDRPKKPPAAPPEDAIPEKGRGENMEMVKAAYVEELLHVKQSKASQIIRILNEELEQQGYLTVRGRIPKEYLLKRFGGDISAVDPSRAEQKQEG